jgi:hypothetical protein
MFLTLLAPQGPPPAGTLAYFKVDGVWTLATVYYKDGGTWKVAQAYWKDAGTWK